MFKAIKLSPTQEKILINSIVGSEELEGMMVEVIYRYQTTHGKVTLTFEDYWLAVSASHFLMDLVIPSSSGQVFPVVYWRKKGRRLVLNNQLQSFVNSVNSNVELDQHP